MKRILLFIWIIAILLTGCISKVSDYGLELIDNDNKYTLNDPNWVTTSYVITPAPDESEPTPDEVEPTPAEVEPTPDEVEPTPDEDEPAPDEDEPAPEEGEPTPYEFEPTPAELAASIECIHLPQEHMFNQTLIDYVGVGNYNKWIETATPSCSNGLNIYDYMDYFNMTKGFFTNLTSRDHEYVDVDLSAYD